MIKLRLTSLKRMTCLAGLSLFTSMTYAESTSTFNNEVDAAKAELALERNTAQLEQAEAKLADITQSVTRSESTTTKNEVPSTDAVIHQTTEATKEAIDQSTQTAQDDPFTPLETQVFDKKEDVSVEESTDIDTVDTLQTDKVGSETTSTAEFETPTQTNTDDQPDDQASEQTNASEKTESTDIEAAEDDSVDRKRTAADAEKLLEKVAPAYEYSVDTPTDYMQSVNQAVWYSGMKVNPYTTLKLQILLDWNHASPGPIDNGWGMNSRKALKAFQEKQGITATGRMNKATWDRLSAGDLLKRPALVAYTITKKDASTRFRATARGYAAKSKMHRLSYRNIYEMFGERFHMNVNFLQAINKGIPFKAGNTITVVNVGKHNTYEIDRVVANKKNETLYAYQGDTLVASYPTTVGSSKTPSPRGNYRITNKVYMPYYNATSKNNPKKKWVLPPGPNNPVGTVWIALSKPTYGIHGSPKPEGISRQRSHGCVRLTNWDAAELYSTIKKGAKIQFVD